MAEIQNCMVRIDDSWRSWCNIGLLGVTFNIIVKRQNQLCTKQTDGIVKQYGFPGNGRVYPIVEYFVNGTCYKAKKKISRNYNNATIRSTCTDEIRSL